MSKNFQNHEMAFLYYLIQLILLFFQIHEVRQYCEHAYSKVHVPESVPDYIILKITGKPDLVKNLLTNEPR